MVGGGCLKAGSSSGPLRFCGFREQGLVDPRATFTKSSFAFQIPYIETSAKDPPLNVDKAFHDLVRVIR